MQVVGSKRCGMTNWRSGGLTCGVWRKLNKVKLNSPSPKKQSHDNSILEDLAVRGTK